MSDELAYDPTVSEVPTPHRTCLKRSRRSMNRSAYGDGGLKLIRGAEPTGRNRWDGDRRNTCQAATSLGRSSSRTLSSAPRRRARSHVGSTLRFAAPISGRPGKTRPCPGKRRRRGARRRCRTRKRPAGVPARRTRCRLELPAYWPDVRSLSSRVGLYTARGSSHFLLRNL